MTTVKEAGKKGGQAKSAAKTAAVRENAKKPRGKWITAVAFAYTCTEGKPCRGVFMKRGNLSMDAMVDAIHDSWQARAWPIKEITDISGVSERFVL